MLFITMHSYVIYADEIQNTNNNSAISSNQTSIEVLSKHAILMDQDSGQILYEHNARQRAYPASTTKLITAILTVENCNLTDEVVVNRNALLGIPRSYTIADLKPDEKISVNDLLHVLLIPSANDAANVLAYHISGSIDKFAEKMNQKALEIGCTDTHFINPSGIHDDNHYSTAYDMALIGKYATKYEIIRQIATNTSYSLSPLPTGTARTFKTTNTLITPKNKYFYEYATGLKTGYTDKAKSCIVATAKKNDVNLLCVILGGDKTEDNKSQRELDCTTLFNYGFNNYKHMNMCTKNSLLDKNTVKNIPVELQNADIIYSESINLMVPANDAYTTETTFISDIELPMNKGTVIGTTTYTVDNVNYSVDLVLNNDVLPSSTLDVQLLFKFLAFLLVVTLLFSLLKRRNRQESKYFKRSLY